MAMQPAKYIIFERDGIEMPIIFPNRLQHADVARECSWMGKPISAGSIAIFGDRLCFGEGSISLGLGSRECDKQILVNFCSCNDSSRRL